MAATTIDIGTLITRAPGLHGSSPHILGKGVTARRIVSWYKRGLSPEEIGDRIGHLTLLSQDYPLGEQIRAVLEFIANRTAEDVEN